ncbi:hypothetical protein OJ997_13725 [Solirubrobacter phytolaccae]|uniref:DUF7144 domain-containing protein n=1 Tax=Solirubrobacter phytolaccae TaxID=1404360 RepID=A0A9X3N7L8_9ACTN|nr:hypothetical protein [Solirubrobacter phytolaccae]MDA0181360.1 hypothetical protein [Solirubrobacter phytolaccae]
MTKTQTRVPPAEASSAGAAWTGWVVFASIMLAVVGLINLVQGFAALFSEDYFVIQSGNELLVGDFETWGIVMLIWGGAQVAAGMGLNTGHGWARVLAVTVACVSILVQIAFLAAFPIWSLTIIALDVIVIYALTARWEEARAEL